jgi:hypothetical protein
MEPKMPTAATPTSAAEAAAIKEFSGDATAEAAIDKFARTEAERPDPQATRSRYAFGTAQAKLPVGRTDPNFHYHWANDEPGRIELFIASGYEYVQKGEVTLLPGVTPRNGDLGSQVSAVVGRNGDGTPLRAYLMKKRMDWYLEDQEKGQERPNQIDAAIRAGRVSSDVDDGHFYVPRNAPIKMGTELRRPKPKDQS